MTEGESSRRFPPRDYGSMSDNSRYSPSEFTLLKETIGANIVNVKSSWKQLEKLTKSIGTFQDNHEQRNRIHNVQTSANEKVIQMSNDLKRLSIMTRYGGSKQQKLEKERIMSEFKKVVEKYSKSQQIAAGKMKKVIIESRKSIEEDEQARKSRDRIPSIQIQIQRNFQSDIEALRERERKYNQLQADILDVHEIFQSLDDLAREQGEKVDTIENTIEHTAGSVEAGREELIKAVQYQAKYRKKVCILIIIAVILGLIVTGIIVSSIKK